MSDRCSVHVLSADGLTYAASLHNAGVVCVAGLVADAVPVIVRGPGEDAAKVAVWLRRRGYRDVRVEVE